MKSYYGKQTPRQMQGKYTRLTAGLNEYTPSVDLNDNLLSDCLDVTPYRESGILFHVDPVTITPVVATGTTTSGYVCFAISDVDTDGVEHIFTLIVDGASKYVGDTKMSTGVTTRTIISDAAILLADSAIKSACLYQTEAFKYVVFASSDVGKLIFFKKGTVTPFTETVGTIAIPFLATKIVAHANRIFALDEKNTLWWSKAGDITGWYTTTQTDSYILEDSGYWVVERERKLSELCVMNDSIYIFGFSNIYIFRGSDYDTFSLDIIVNNIGVESSAYRQHLSSVNNKAYFVSSIYNKTTALSTVVGADIYEFDGNSEPKIISRPIFVNTGLINGVLGGIYNTKMTHLTADENSLYFYQQTHLTASGIDNYLYKFDIETRTWWKLSGMNTNVSGITDSFNTIIIPTSDRSDVHIIVYED